MAGMAPERPGTVGSAPGGPGGGVGAGAAGAGGAGTGAAGTPRAPATGGPTGWKDDLRPLLDFRSAAIVGASPANEFALTLYRNLRQGGFSGPVYLVNPHRSEVLGEPCYASLDALPGPVDCAFITVRAERCAEAVEEVGRAGIPAAVVFATGFAEAGPEGRARQERLAEVALRHRVRLMGPNCMGLMNPRTGAMACGYHMPRAQPGHIAFISQSGLVFWSLCHNTRGVRFSYAVSCGNEAVLTLADYMRYVLQDPSTRVIALWIESLRDVPGFIAACEEARARGVPVVALKVGRSQAGDRLVRAHSGALAGSDAVYGAAFRKYGVARARNLDELLDTLELLSFIPELPAEGLAAVTDSGGERALLVDLAEDLGLRFPPVSPEGVERLAALFPGAPEVSNPIDIWQAGQGRYEELLGLCFETFGAEPGIGLCLVALDMLAGTPDAERYAQCTIEFRRSGRTPVAVLPHVAGAVDERQVERLRREGIPVLRGTEHGLRAVRHLIDLGRARRRPRAARPAPDPERRRRALELLARAGGRRVLTEAEAKELVRLYGIPVTPERLVRTPEEAVAAAEAIGYPVVAKVCSPRFPHKTDVGGVRLGLRDAGAVRAAFAELWRLLSAGEAGCAGGRDDRAAGGPGPEEGVLVQAMVQGGVEVLLGLARDPQFGPVLTLGGGGVTAELYADVRLLLPPLSEEEVLEELAQLRLHRLLAGFRGRPPADAAALARAAVALSAMALELEDHLAEVDINPLLVQERGAVAVDALVVLR